MEGEFNNLTFENTKITFTNTPNNTQTSDELKAGPLYYRSLGTAYSRGKKVKVAIITVGVGITASSSVFLASRLFNNSFVKAPAIDNFSLVASESPTEINLSFTISKNENKYTVIFTLYDMLGEEIYNLKAKELKTYQETITDLKPDTKYRYEMKYTNNIDLIKKTNDGYITTNKGE